MILHLLKKEVKKSLCNGIRRQKSTISPQIDDATAGRKFLHKPGDLVSGFTCTRSKYIQEFNMTAYVFKHERTGLEYLHVARPDTNNVFSVNFRTTPGNSTGLPHILEHSVLCGSEKFPVRDPFFKMLNRSLATFMNAMTGPDYTLYPFSSTNECDYRNLQSIYLDAVFKPNLKYLDFLQEGWRLEHADLKNKNSELMFKGVVYNEMKGAFSENSAVFGQKFFNKILPDHTYGVVSGGDPLDIPQLTHKDLVDFHQKYYHPSNARMFSYGNFDLTKTLDYVNQNYLQVDPINPNYSVVPNQTRWTEPRFEHITSRFDNMGAPIERQHQIGIGFLMTDICDIYENFVIYVLTELLVKGPNSYFYKSLIEPNISGGYNGVTGFDSSIKDTMFSVGLQDLSADDFQKVQKIFEQTLYQVLETGFDAQHVESVLHNIELSMKHQTTKFGLGLLFNLTPLWNHGTGDDLIRSMSVSDTLKRFRENLNEPRYLEKQVEKYFISNTHKLVLTMSPDKDHEMKFNDAEKHLLAQKVDALQASDKEKVFNDGLALAESQKAPQDLNLLPCLKLEDIKKEVPRQNIVLPLIKNVPTQVCTTDTNGVTYFRGVLDASHLTKEEKILLPLFISLADQFGTTKTDYRIFDKRVHTKTAGLQFSVHLADNVADRSYEIGMLFGTYALNENVPAMFNLLAELFMNFGPADEERFRMLVENYVSQLSNGIADSGHLYAMQAAGGLVSEAGQLKEMMMGVAHLEYMRTLLEVQSVHEIMESIQKIGVKLFNEASLRCALTQTNPNLEPYEAFLSVIRPNLDSTSEIWHKSKLLPASSKHSVMTIPVNYCAKALATVPYTHADFAPLRVLSRLLSSKYLLPVVREQNGAYGAGAKISYDGVLTFFSYRDPNSVRTLEVFDESSDWLKDFSTKIDDQVLFEAKLGVLQQIDAPIAPVDQGVELFRYRITREMLETHRKQILEATKEDLLRVSERYLRPGQVENVGRCVLGPENPELAQFLVK